MRAPAERLLRGLTGGLSTSPRAVAVGRALRSAALRRTGLSLRGARAAEVRSSRFVAEAVSSTRESGSPSVLTVACMAGSIILLGLAVKTLPIGTAYAVWTGIGAVGTAILGIILFGDPATALRLACIGLIVAGIVGLKFVT